jgi:hypothetical protein
MLEIREEIANQITVALKIVTTFDALEEDVASAFQKLKSLVFYAKPTFENPGQPMVVGNKLDGSGVYIRAAAWEMNE